MHIRAKYFTCIHDDCAQSQKTYEERKNERVHIKRAHRAGQETTREQVDSFIKMHQRDEGDDFQNIVKFETNLMNAPAIRQPAQIQINAFVTSVSSPGPSNIKVIILTLRIQLNR